MKKIVFSFLFALITLNISAIGNPSSLTVQIDTMENNVLYYKIFNKSGALIEEAFWKDGKNIGIFIRYHDNGVLAQQFNFDEQGRRVGKQKYFFKNGEERLGGRWANGEMDGRIVWYTEEGEIESSISRNVGTVDKRITAF
jgi:antitoxin component YwqK of YwqJK toxin-antitoxin module